MDDTLSCPICNQALRNTKESKKHLHPVDKIANYMERVCTGYNHIFAMWIDQATQEVDFVKVVLEPMYSKVISVDFVNKKTTLELKGSLINGTKIIQIPKVLELDFPDLSNLKEKIGMYSLFI